MKNQLLSFKSQMFNTTKKILILSDFHLTINGESKNIIKLLNFLKENESKYDYILFVGDFTNDASYFNNSIFCNRAQYIINLISSFIKSNGKLIFSIGNHDFMMRKDDKWVFDKNCLFKKFIKTHTDALILDNEVVFFEETRLAFYGLTNSLQFYEGKKEDPEVFHKELTDLIKYNELPDEYTKFCLPHAVRSMIQNPQDMEKFDFSVGGHYHNGCIPNFLSDAPTSIGIFHPQDKTFPSFPSTVRGTFEYNGSYAIINGAINPFNEMQTLNNLYGSYFTTLKLMPKKRNI